MVDYLYTSKREAGVIVDKDGAKSVRGDDYNYAVSNRTMKKFLDSSNIEYIISKIKKQSLILCN